jgi:CBS domain-containing protein
MGAQKMTIAAILEGKDNQVLSVEASTPLREAVAMLAQKRIGAMPVLESGRVTGIISERDIIYRLSEEGAAALDRTVGEVMSAPAITVGREGAVLGALSQMTRRRIRHLPVIENDELIGIVSIGDLVAYRINRIEQEAEALRTYIQTA